MPFDEEPKGCSSSAWPDEAGGYFRYIGLKVDGSLEMAMDRLVCR